MSLDDAYVELGLAPGASDAAVKAAWRRLVSQWHPDRNASAEAAALMQRINGAYDRIRLAAVTAVGRERDDDGAGDGDGAGRAGARPADATSRAGAAGRVVERRVRLSIEDVALGCTRVLRGRLHAVCAACSGSGRLPLQRCRACDGSGRRRSGLWLGWPVVSVACGDCGGAGRCDSDCPACERAGRLTTRYRCTVRLPAGLGHGDVLQADGGGGHRGGFDGTLELRVAVAPHAFFEVGADGVLRCEFPVDGFAWLAEQWIDVPAPSGLQQMRLRRGRRVYRLRGQGLPLQRGGSERGDYVVTVVPAFPDRTDAEQQALLERLAAIAAAAPPKALGAWRQRLRAWERKAG